MTIIEAINKIDELKPNTYEQSLKVKWLSDLDGQVKREIVDTHEGCESVTYNGYDEETPIDTVLLIPSPYDDVYIKWLEAQIDYANAETMRYNNSITMYNNAMATFASYYNRTYMPKEKVQFKYF